MFGSLKKLSTFANVKRQQTVDNGMATRSQSRATTYMHSQHARLSYRVRKDGRAMPTKIHNSRKASAL